MLAIIIPYYKRSFFEATLQSLASQTSKQFKVYIGDDASPENPIDLIESFKGQFDFIYHRFETNYGSSSLTQQWERCIALSKSEEWLMILGDDDVLGENVVEEFYNQFSAFHSRFNVIRFSSLLLNEKNNQKSKVFYHPIIENSEDSFYRKFKGKTRSSLSEYIFSKKVFKRYGFMNYPVGWFSDDMAWLNFSENKPLYSINEAVVSIRISEISLSGKKSNNELKDIAAFQFYKEIVKNWGGKFSKKQRLEFLMKYESAIKNIRKVKINEWGWIFWKYMGNFDLVSIINLCKRILISIIYSK